MCLWGRFRSEGVSSQDGRVPGRTQEGTVSREHRWSRGVPTAHLPPGLGRLPELFEPPGLPSPWWPSWEGGQHGSHCHPKWTA